jgi:flotillin
MLEHLDTLAETSAKAIANVKFDKIVVWDSGQGNGATSNFLQNMSRALPPMMQVVRDIAGVELPSYLGTLAPEAAPVKDPGVTPVKPIATATAGD